MLKTIQTNLIKSRQNVLKPQFINKRYFSLDYFDLNEISISGLNAQKPSSSVKFTNLFLRDADQNQTSVDSSTKQKSFSTGDISCEIYAEKAYISGSNLNVHWNDGINSIYSKKFLSDYSSSESRRKIRRLGSSEWIQWKNLSDISQNIYKISYDEYMKGQKGFSHTLDRLNKVGLVMLTDVPRSPDDSIQVENIARSIGYVKQTFYGSSWNVRSVPQAKNIAYTNVYLPLHMDLCYYESPPGLQLLHVIENQAVGGESLFADSYSAALHVLQTDVEAYKALCTIPFSFHYVNDGYHYYYQRPLIVEDAFSPIDSTTNRHEISHLNYSPPFQAPLDSISTFKDISQSDLNAFTRGLKLFESHINDPKNQYEIKVPENTCLIFFNRRILHGRKEFDVSSGYRWFQGTYLDIDSFYSKLRTTGGTAS